MACGYYRTDEDGNIKKSPIVSRVIESIDEALASGSEINFGTIFAPLNSEGNMSLIGDMTERSFEFMVQEIADVNAVAAVHYGVPMQLVTITPYKLFGKPEIRYRARVSTKAIEFIGKNTTPYLPSAEIAYETAYGRLRIQEEAEKVNLSNMVDDEEQLLRPAVYQALTSEVEYTKANAYRTGEQLGLFDSKSTLEDMKPIEVSSITKDIQNFKDAFAKAGVNLEVVIDPQLEVKGRVISSATGGLKIALNPLKITEDTHIHEFGHILIELLGDNNVTVKRAIEELQNTNLYKQIQELYPELSKKDLDKEVLVTAMGLTGAKIRRESPNLFQRIFNKIVRALSKVLNLEQTPSAVEQLTQTLLQGTFTAADLKGSITFLMADSRSAKDQKEFMAIVDEVRIATQNTIDKLRREPGGVNETAIETIALMQKRLDKIKDVEELVDFVDYATRLATRAEDNLEKINQQYSENLTTKERLQLVHQLYKVGEYVRDFYGGLEAKNNLMQSIRNLVGKDIQKLNRNLSLEQRDADPKYQALSSLEKKLIDAIDRMGQVEGDYRDVGIPMMADLLMEYRNDEVNDEIDKLIDNIKKNDRLVAIERDEEYYTIKKNQKEKKLSDAEAHEALVKLNVKQLENKRITRETLIAELTEAQKDKSAFSYLLDPLIYSSQVGLQMFANLVKDKMYQANDDTQDDIYELAAAYKEYQKVKGAGLDPNKFNEEILEEHEVYIYNPDTQKKEKMKLLSFVQEYDITRYKNAESAMYEALAKKYGKPETDDELVDWFKNKSTVKAYYKEVAAWYKDNSVPSADSKAKYEKLSEKLSRVRKQLLEEKAKEAKDIDPDKVQFLESEQRSLMSLMEKMYDADNNQWKISAVRPNDKYKNSKYESLKNNAPAFAYYTAMLNFYQSKQKMLGETSLYRNSWDSFSYVVPSVRSQGLEKVQKDGAFSAAKDFAKDKFAFLSTDTNYGALINANQEARGKTVPIFYTNPLESKLVSRDIASSLILFGGMTNMFRRKSEIVGSVMLMRDIIENRKVLETNSANIPLAHRMSNVLKGVKHQTTADGKDSNNFKHLSEWIDKIFFGEEEIKKSLNVFGRELSANKLANSISSFTALNNLAGNLLQATNQMLLDNVRFLQEANSQQFFDKKNMAWAKATYHFTTNGGLASLKDYKAFTPSTKLVQAIKYFDALGEVLGSTKEDKTGPRALKFIQEGPMALQTIAEHETAVTRMLALMDSYTGKLKDKDGNVIKNADGKDANLWDVFVMNEKTGRYEIDARVANFSRSKFIGKISGINKKTNQVKTKFDDAILQRRWYGKLIMLFRRYFVPSLRKNFGHNGLRGGIHRDLELGVVSEGVLETFWRFTKETVKNYGNGFSVYKSMTDMEKQNMRRALISISFYVVAGLIAGALMGDDDDDDSWANQFAIYQALRMQSELSQFLDPMEFLKMANSPTATTKPITRAYELVEILAAQTAAAVTGNYDGLYYERKSGIHKKGDSKFLAKLESLLPIVGGIEKASDPKTASKYFDLPASATK